MEQKIEAESAERIKSLNNQLNPLKADLTELNQQLTAQTQTRISKEQTILQAMADGNEKIAEAMDQEREERNKQIADMKIIDDHIEAIDKRMNDFTAKTKKDFEDMESDMMKEMTSRFD